MIPERGTGKVASIVVLVPPGDLLTDEANDALAAAIRSAEQAGVDSLVVDLRHVDLINSTGFGVLIDGFRRFKTRSAHFKLCAMTHRVRHILTLTKLLPSMEAFESVEEALASFAPGART